MPTQSLLDDLDNLLSAYNQRRRATDALLRGLKGAHNALTKADRTLADYLEQPSTLEQTQLDRLAPCEDGWLR